MSPKFRQRARRAVTALAVAALLGGSLTACSERSEVNEMLLLYSSGVGDNREFKGCVRPGASGDWSPDDDVFSVPADKRTWNVQPVAGADEEQAYVSGSAPNVDPNTKQSRSGPQVAVWFTTDFYLNTDCGITEQNPKGSKDSPVVQFFNQTGRTAQISSNSGGFDANKWKAMLGTTLASSIRDVIQSQTRRYDADVLKDDLSGVYNRMEASIAPILQAKVNEKMGGSYFCGIGFKGGQEVEWQEPMFDPKTGDPIIDPVTEMARTETKKGPCPPVRIDITNIDLADSEIQAAADGAYAVELRNKAALEEAQGRNRVAEELKNGGPGAVELQRQANELELERERTKQVQQCAAAGAQCTVVLGGGTPLVGVK